MGSPFMPPDQFDPWAFARRARSRLPTYGGLPEPTYQAQPQQAPPPPQRGIADYAMDLGRGIASGVSTVLAPLGWAKQYAVDPLARFSARSLGLTVPDEMTTQEMLGSALFGERGKEGSGGLLDAGAISTLAASALGASTETLSKIQQAYQPMQAAENDPGIAGQAYRIAKQGVLRPATEFATSLATDPFMAVGIPGAGAAEQYLSRGSKVAAKLLARPEIGEAAKLYAPEVATALKGAIETPVARQGIAQFAAKLGVSPEALTQAGVFAAKLPERLMIGQMAVGGAGSIADSAKQMLAEGKITPESAAEMVQGGLEAAMGGMGAVHMRGEGLARRKALEGVAGVRPTRLLPIDEVPDPLQPRAERHARDLAEAIASGKEPEELGILPEELQPHSDAIWRQANEEAQAIKEGDSFLERLRTEHQSGEKGVSVEQGPDGTTRVIQRNKQGEIVGGASVKDGYLQMIAGGKRQGHSIAPVYEKLQELGVKSMDMLETLSAQGALARRRGAEKLLRLPREVLEGGVNAAEFGNDVAKAREDFFNSKLDDALRLQPAYAADGGPALYSQLRRVVTDPKTQATQRGADWLKFLSDPKRQVKAAELKWTGLDEYLKGRSGERVSRQEIDQFLDRNEVQIDESMAGETLTPEESARYGQLVRNRNRTPEEAAEINALEAKSRPTKFEQYTLPGGEPGSYRELKITRKKLPSHVYANIQPDAQAVEQYRLNELPSPDLRPESMAIRRRAIADTATRLRERGERVSEPVRSFRDWAVENGRLSPEDAAAVHGPEAGSLFDEWRADQSRVLQQQEEFDKSRREFQSTHFPEANILAHVRFKDDKGPNGEKVLRVEEIQSDWAEVGRDVGFQGQETEATRELEAEANRLKARQTELARMIPDARVEWRNAADATPTVENEHGSQIYVESSPEYARLETVQEKLKKLINERDAHVATVRDLEYKLKKIRGEGVPGGPFVQKTEDWTNLALKRIMKYAADNGYDKVAWTTGEQQAARYDLSHHIDSLDWRKNPDGTINITGWKNGSPVVDLPGVKPEELGRNVGKEVGAKILEASAKSGETPPIDDWRKLDDQKLRQFAIVLMEPEGTTAEEMRGLSRRELEDTVMHHFATPDSDFDVASQWGDKGSEYTRWGNSKTGGPAAINHAEVTQNFNKLIGTSGGTLNGLDLKVGGEGMKAYYDEIVPQLADKIVRKFGAKVGKTEISVPPALDEWQYKYEGPDVGYNELAEWYSNNSTNFVVPVQILDQGRRVLGAMGAGDSFEQALLTHGSAGLAEYFGGKMLRTDQPTSTTVHAIDIPEQMRETVKQEGFPLFAAGKEGEAATKAKAADTRKLLVKLYPEGSKIKEHENGIHEITLPNKRKVIWKQGVDHIEIQTEAFEKGHGPVAGRKAVGVTWRLKNSAIVEIMDGASPRVPIHEHWHVLKHLGSLTERQEQILKKKFGGNEELEADAYADWFEGGMKEANTIWQRIHQGVRNIYESVTGQTASVFREATKQALVRRADAGLESTSGPWKNLWGTGGPLANQRNVNGELRTAGAPPEIVDLDNFNKLRQKVTEMAKEGEVARPWYRRSSQMILDAAHGNKADAEKIAQLVSIYSPREKVAPNIENAMKAWAQFKAGDKKITAGRDQNHNRSAERLLFNGEQWEGRKTNNFYGNLMLQIDPDNPALKDLVTVDVHMMKALGYETTAPGPAQYTWAEKLFTDVAHDLGWEPHEVQAAVWTSQKYRREVLSKLKPGETPPPVVSYDFEDAVKERLGHVNMEAVPHPTTGVLPELASADFETRKRYTDGLRDTVLFKDGRDRIAEIFGIPTHGGFLSPGFYAGRGEPGFRTEVMMPTEMGGMYAAFREMGLDGWKLSRDARKMPAKAVAAAKEKGYALDRRTKTVWIDPARAKDYQDLGLAALDELSGQPGTALKAFERARELDPSVEKLVRRYAAAMGYVMRQEGVGYGRTFPEKSKSAANAYYFGLDRRPTQTETETLMGRVAEELGTTADDPRVRDIFPKTVRDGIVVVNYSDIPQATFLDAVDRAGKKAFVDTDVNTGYARERGGLVSNDWVAKPNGESYAEAMAEAEAAAPGSPSVQGRVERLRQEVDAYNERFAGQQGWRGTEAGPPRTGPAPEAAGVVARPEGRGPPGTPVYAAGPAPLPSPTGTPKVGGPPRVETRVEGLEDALREQRQLGIPAEDLNLSRVHRRTWKSLDPSIKKLIVDWDDKKMLDTMKRRALDDDEVQALDAVVRGRREAKDEARLDYIDAKGTAGEDAAWRKYAQSLANFVPLERANVNDGSGTARALAARARLMEAAQTKDRTFLRQVFRELPGVDEQGALEMLQMFETGDPRLADALRAATAGRWKQWQTLLRSFLITPSSEIANTLGNTLVQGIETADTAAAAGTDWVISKLRGTQRERHIGEVGAEIGGMLEAAPRALKEFLDERFRQIYKRAWTGEAKKVEPGKRFEYQVSPFRSKLGRLFGTSLDALEAGDELFQAPVARGELMKRAYRMAKAEMPTANKLQLQARMAEIATEAVNRPEAHAQLLNDVRSAVGRRLFRDKPWAPVQILKNMQNRYPWLSAVLPFVKTPANIARYAIHHSPLGMMTPDFAKATLTALGKGDGTMTQGQAADIIARRVTGTVIFGTAVAAAKMGKLTGSGPADPKERQALMETGWRPYSIVAQTPGGKLYIPYNRFDPVAQMVGVAADIVELPNMRDANDIATKAIGSITENFTNRTYLKGLVDFSNALSDPLQFAGNYAIGIGEMHIPRQLARIAQAIDPVMRDVRPVGKGPGAFMDRVVSSAMRNVPGLSQMLPARYGPTGEPIVRPGEGVAGALMRSTSPIQISPERQGRNLEGLMAQIGYVPADPKTSMTIKGQQIPLERDQLELVHKADRAAAYELRLLVNNPLFGHLPDTIEEGGSRSKEGVIRKIYDKHRDLARQEIMRSWAFQTKARETLARRPTP